MAQIEQIQKKKDLMQQCGKICHCGHLVIHHRYTGCVAIVEGSECEDHWSCGCTCTQCVHKNEYNLKQLAKETDVDNY